MGKLILVRHAKSEWNKKGIWTGLTDIGLAPEGREEAKRTAEEIRGLPIQKAYTSALTRAKETWDIMRETLGLAGVPTKAAPELNERDYGIFTGKNKWEIQKEVGEEKFQRIRRGWAEPIPGGESLKDVYARVAPFYETAILPALKKGENIALIAHGNSLRALMKHLEGLTDEAVEKLEFGVGEACVYEVDADGHIVSKEVRSEHPEKGKI